MIAHHDEPITPSGGNVFADLDLPDAGDRLAKAELARQIGAIFRERGLTQRAAAQVLGADQPKVSALLSGLETRGVPIDRWRFHADAGRVFREPGAPPLTLKQLFRLRAESPLLVVSAGEGLLEGIAGRTAPKGKRMGHAGAIIAGGKGTAAEKIAALEAAGIEVAQSPADMGAAMQRAIKRKR